MQAILLLIHAQIMRANIFSHQPAGICQTDGLTAPVSSCNPTRIVWGLHQSEVIPPTRDISALRTYMRIRERHLEYAAANLQHTQKALTHMNLQLRHVISAISGVPGLKIIRAMVQGERDPEALAAMRDVRCRESGQGSTQGLGGHPPSARAVDSRSPRAGAHGC